MSDKIETEQIVPTTGTTKFGIQGLQNPTPQWATWCFRGEFIANKFIMLWLSATHLVPAAKLPEIILALTIIDGAVWTLARFVGVKKSDLEEA